MREIKCVEALRLSCYSYLALRGIECHLRGGFSGRMLNKLQHSIGRSKSCMATEIHLYIGSKPAEIIALCTLQNEGCLRQGIPCCNCKQLTLCKRPLQKGNTSRIALQPVGNKGIYKKCSLHLQNRKIARPIYQPGNNKTNGSKCSYSSLSCSS